MPPGKKKDPGKTPIKSKPNNKQKVPQPFQPPNPQQGGPQGPDTSNFPLLQYQFSTGPLEPKKWCVRFNVPILKANCEYYVDGTRVSVPPDSSYFVQKNAIVRLIAKSDDLPGWFGIAFERTLYRNVDMFHKAWVTMRVAGWVEAQYLDDYYEEFPNFDGVVLNKDHQSKDSSDAEQVLIIGVEKVKGTETVEIYDEFAGRKFNLCGEFSLAYAAHQSIDDVIEKWRTASPKVFDSMIGEGRDKPLGQFEIDNILTMALPGAVHWEHYVPDAAKPGETVALKVSLSETNNPRRASVALQEKLKSHYLITNVRINTHTGELVPKGDEDRNHWIVLDKVTHNGKRVELYNPFPNQRQSYSFGEFFYSVGSNPNRGWWIEKKQKDTSTENNLTQQEKDEVIVAIDNPTLSTIDAEQYAFIEGEPTKKNMLCGEFSVSYILTQSLERNLKNWLAGHAQVKPELPELVRMSHAYGFNHRKYAVEDPSTKVKSIKLDLDAGGAYFKSFSIDTILQYWKHVQPKLYESILHDRNDTGTGPEDLKTILKAYGYKIKGTDHPIDYDVSDYLNDTKNGESLRPPGKDHEELKTHYLIACVLIETVRGALVPRNAGGKTALHWVVVTKITPFGSQAGCNGGWVELYNPFSNRLEEYSYKEFITSYSAPAVWVKREITPSFNPQKLKLFRDGDLKQASEITSTKKKEDINAWSTDKLLNEIQKMRNKGKTDQQLPALLFGKNTGWSKEDLDAFVAKQSPKPTTTASQSVARLGKILKDCLNLKDDMPKDLLSLISEALKENPGDENFALEMANSLREYGFLSFAKVQKPPNPATSGQNLKSASEPKRALSFRDTPVPPAALMRVSIAGSSAAGLEKIAQTARAQALAALKLQAATLKTASPVASTEQLDKIAAAARSQAEKSLRLQLAAMEIASHLTDKVANAIRPMFVEQVQEKIKNIRLQIAQEQEQAKTGGVVTIKKVSPFKPAYRVMWDWEGWAVGAKKINRPELPCVFRCGDINDPNSDAPFIDLTEEWQFFWFDLCCWVYYGRYHQDLTDEEYKWLANKWTSVGDSKRAFTNGKGLERYKNFVLGEPPKRPGLPKIQTLVCGGASLAGTPVQATKGKKEWMLKVAHFDANRTPPDVRTIDPYADPRVFFATTIAYDEKPGYKISTFDPKTGRQKPGQLDLNEAFGIGRFPEFDREDPKTDEKTLIDCPVPIIATSDIYYPMRFLVPITDGKKANPYYPAKPYTGFGSPQP